MVSDIYCQQSKTLESLIMTQLKYNPFQPNNITHPGMFTGRYDELVAIEKCLFQTKNGNPQHFLVQGERGIDKSSLFYYVELIARSKITSLHNIEFNFLTVSSDLGNCENQLDIVRKIGRGLREAVSKNNKIKEKAKIAWNWLANWEVLGVKYNKDNTEFDLEETIEDFVTNLVSLIDSTQEELDGVLFLLDEADHPTSEAGLGNYIKLVTERLSRKGCSKIVFGLAGLPTLLPCLRDSHESSPRLFQTMLLEPLSFEEQKKVVNIGIEEANKKNEIKTTISSSAIDFLASLSEGYPHFVQQFSYCAFEHDTDNDIDVEDVGEGAFKKGGALSQLGDKFFYDMYHARISSEDYRRVLDSMAEYGTDWITRKTIIGESGVKDFTVTNALGALKNKQIIIQDDTRRGYYRLPTASFATWINAIREARAKSDIDAIESSPFD